MNPNQFGANVGAAERGVGQDLGQAGREFANVAVQRQNIINETASDDAFNKFQDYLHTQQFGDPNDPSNPGYYSLKGQDALNARPGVESNITQQQKQILGGLQNDRQRIMFNAASRRLMTFTLDSIGRHADQQFDVYANDTQAASEAIALRNISTFYNDDNAFNHNLEELRGAAVKKAQLAGAGSNQTMLTAALNDADSKAVVARVQAQSVPDPAGASDFLEAHKNMVAPAAYEQLSGHLKGLKNDALAPQLFQQAYGATVGADGQPKGPSPSFAARVDAAESGGNPNAKNPSSSATGPGQFINQTFLDQVKRNAPEVAQGKTDDQILAMRSNKDLSDRMTNSYATENAGFLAQRNLPVTDGSLYLAHFAGPQGAASVLSADPTTPVKNILSPAAIQANPQLASMTAGELRQWADNKMAGGQTVTSRSDTLNRIADATKNDLALQRTALTYANTQFRLQDDARIDQERAQRSAEQQKKEQSDAAEHEYIARLSPLPGQNVQPPTLAEISNDTRLSNPAALRLRGLLASGGDESDPKKYGQGFYDLFHRSHLPDGDPQKISSPADLYSHVGPGGDLTVAGLDKLTSDINGRRDPGSEGTSKMIAGALAYAKHQLSFEADYGFMKVRDPKGEDAFNTGFLPAFYKAYDAGIANGKTPNELLSKDSPDFIVDKLAASFKRSPSQLLKDQMDSGVEANVPQPGAPQAPNVHVPAITLPQVNEVRDGYRFNGGNPADPKSWVKLAGPVVPIAGQP